jgi:HSP20 family protein
MTKLITRTRPATLPVFQDLFERLFDDDMFHDMRGTSIHSVPVNIRNTETSYELSIVAPGLRKEDFTIQINRDMLTVSFDKKEETNEEQDNWIRREFVHRSFNRSFHLDDTVNTEAIGANYVDGLLSISIPKKAPSELPIRTISVN